MNGSPAALAGHGQSRDLPWSVASKRGKRRRAALGAQRIEGGRPGPGDDKMAAIGDVSVEQRRLPIGDRRQRGRDHHVVAGEFVAVGADHDVERHVVARQPFDHPAIFGEIGALVDAVGGQVGPPVAVVRLGRRIYAGALRPVDIVAALRRIVDRDLSCRLARKEALLLLLDPGEHAPAVGRADGRRHLGRFGFVGMTAGRKRFRHHQEAVVGLLAVGEHPRRLGARGSLREFRHADHADPIVRLRVAHAPRVAQHIGFPHLHDVGARLEHAAVEPEHGGGVVVDGDVLHDHCDIGSDRARGGRDAVDEGGDFVMSPRDPAAPRRVGPVDLRRRRQAGIGPELGLRLGAHVRPGGADIVEQRHVDPKPVHAGGRDTADALDQRLHVRRIERHPGAFGRGLDPVHALLVAVEHIGLAAEPDLHVARVLLEHRVRAGQPVRAQHLERRVIPDDLEACAVRRRVEAAHERELPRELAVGQIVGEVRIRFDDRRAL